MESTSVVTASCTLIPSNPQVRILPFPHHSMPLLLKQPSEAKAVTSNPHSLVSSLPNESPWCSWTTEHSVKQPPTPSPFQTSRVPLIPFPARPQVTGGVCRQYHVITKWITPISQTHDSKTDRFHYQNNIDETDTNKPPPIPSQHSPHPQRLPTPHLLLFLSLHWLEWVEFECDHEQ